MSKNIDAGRRRIALADLFAELACESSLSANRILDQFPDYRHAKDDDHHPFWNGASVVMINAILALDSVRLYA